jgi:malate dehydrogenase
MQKNITVAVSGAGGQIGYALLFRLASGQMFGVDTSINLHLLEVEAALPALHGVAMELDDCAFPLLKKVICTSDLKQAMDGINWAVLVGAAPRKAGMERSDLLKVNGGIFTKQGRAINDYASSDVCVFVVGNPCNTNCLIAMNNAPDISNDRFYAMTLLDENRGRMQLAKKAGVDVTEVTNMTIWGNHSSTQYPDFYHAKIKGQKALDVIKDETWLQKDFISIVQNRGAEVIKARGASSAASAANAAIGSVYHLTHPTPTNETFSVCRASQGEYDIDKDLIFSFPCRNTGHQIEVMKDLKQNEFGQKMIQRTLEELRAERDAVRELGLIE